MVQHVRTYQLEGRALQQRREHRVYQCRLVHAGRRAALHFFYAEHLRHQPQGHAPSDRPLHGRLVGRVLAGKSRRPRPHLRDAYQHRRQKRRRRGRRCVGFYMEPQQEHPEDAAQECGTPLPAQQGYRLGGLHQPRLRHTLRRQAGRFVEGWRAVSPQGAQQPLLLVHLQPG